LKAQIPTLEKEHHQMASFLKQQSKIKTTTSHINKNGESKIEKKMSKD
jgi:hypothetical protein